MPRMAALLTCSSRALEVSETPKFPEGAEVIHWLGHFVDHGTTVTPPAFDTSVDPFVRFVEMVLLPVVTFLIVLIKTREELCLLLFCSPDWVALLAGLELAMVNRLACDSWICLLQSRACTTKLGLRTVFWFMVSKVPQIVFRPQVLSGSLCKDLLPRKGPWTRSLQGPGFRVLFPEPVSQNNTTSWYQRSTPALGMCQAAPLHGPGWP